MNNEKVDYKVKNNPRWIGVLLSLILPGAGQFQQRRVTCAVAMFVITFLLPLLAAIQLSIWFIPPSLCVIVYLTLIPWRLYVLYDAWSPTPRMAMMSWLKVIVISLVFQGCYGLVLSSLFKVYVINSSAMSPIRANDVVFCNRAGYLFQRPKRGEIVVFNHKSFLGDETLIYCKRIVAVAGDRVMIKQGILTVNNTPYQCPGQLDRFNYANDVGEGRFLKEGIGFEIPPQQIFVMGDDPANSLDSRYYGPIEMRAVQGQITAIIWPVNHIQRLF